MTGPGRGVTWRLTERVAPFDPEAHAVLRYLNLAHYLGAPPAPPRFRLGLDAEVDISAPAPGRGRDGPWRCSIPGPAGPASSGPRRPGPDWRSGSAGSRASRWPSPAAPRIRSWPRALCAQMPGAGSSIWPGAPRWPELAARAAPSPLGRHHRHRRHAPGRGPGDAGGGPLRPHRPLAHRAFRRRATRWCAWGCDCSPCFKRRCPEPRCLTDLTPEMVAGRLRENLVSG